MCGKHYWDLIQLKKKLINSHVYLTVLENTDSRGLFYSNWFCFLFKLHNVFSKIKKNRKKSMLYVWCHLGTGGLLLTKSDFLCNALIIITKKLSPPSSPHQPPQRIVPMSFEGYCGCCYLFCFGFYL